LNPTKSARALLVLCLSLPTACGRARSSDSAEREPSKRHAPRPGVLATVNDVPITEAEVRLRSKSSSHETGKLAPDATAHAEDPATSAAVLETIIREELMAQRAVELGLELAPADQEVLAAREAELAVFRREKLADLYVRHDRARVEVTDAEARRYWDDNAARLRRQLHVMQILVREEARIEDVQRRLEAGADFEEVARSMFPNLPAEAPRPWDLGFLRWSQLPETWRPALERLEKGHTTGILRGPRNRFWIVKLVDAREDADATFDSLRAHIMEVLRAEKLAAVRAEAQRKLRDGARITYTNRPGR
jgi:parvulin-like peptidyl-prolyl isomerase